MRKLMLSALIGLGTLGVTASAPNEANASWISDALNHSQIQVSIGSQYPGYAAPGYAPAPAYPAYPAYSPVPTYAQPAYSSYPSPVCTPAPVVPAPAYRPAPVNVPQYSYYGPNHYDRDRHDWHDGRNDHDWHR